MRFTQYGQSLSEYVLIAASALVLAIPALLTLGNNLNSIWMGMLPMDKATSGSASASAGLSSGMPSNVQFSHLPVKIPAASGINAASSLPAAGSASTDALIKTVETLGVNGATEQLSNTLIDMANQLLAEGQIEQSSYNEIIALANQGHRLADIESAIVSAAKSAGNKGGAGFDNAMVELDGQSYRGEALSAMISTSGADVTRFQQLMDKVVHASTIDPATRTTISQLSTGILNLANASAESSDWMQLDGSQIDAYWSFTDDLPDLIGDYAKDTKKNANGICNAQGNKKACTRED